MSQSIWKKNFKLPESSLKDWLWWSVFLILPNVLFWLLAFNSHVSRPLFNADYLWVMVLLVLPWRWNKAIGVLLFWALLLLDVLMLVVQIFPFLDINAIRYFLPFLWTAPKPYLFGLAVLGVYCVLMPIPLLKVAKRQNRFWTIVASVLAMLVAQFMMEWEFKYRNFSAIMGRNNYYYVHSQYQLYKDLMGGDFVLAGKMIPQLEQYPNNENSASALLTQPFNQKILFIIAESWGRARTDEMQKDILKALYQRQNQFEFIKFGNVDFIGATVNGELRELCNMKSKNGYAFNLLDKQQFAHCLPNQLLKQGYQTIAMHATSGQLYDRVDWYKKAGFQQAVFGENFLQKPHCTAFNGVCDSALVDEVSNYFVKHQNDKIFYYWLTLTSHQPYPKQDIRNTRFNCEQYKMRTDGEICHNAMLHTQFFDDLAQLLDKPEMKGVEVVVVGDHMPPFLSDEPIHPFLRYEAASWVHLKVKP